MTTAVLEGISSGAGDVLAITLALVCWVLLWALIWGLNRI